MMSDDAERSQSETRVESLDTDGAPINELLLIKFQIKGPIGAKDHTFVPLTLKTFVPVGKNCSRCQAELWQSPSLSG
jgi:hypothetical protein